MILVRNIIIQKRRDNDDGTYVYDRIVEAVNRIMTKRELNDFQKQKATEFGVTRNMVASVLEEF